MALLFKAPSLPAMIDRSFTSGTGRGRMLPRPALQPPTPAARVLGGGLA